MQQRSRLTVDQVMGLRGATFIGIPVPLSAVGHVRTETVPDHPFPTGERERPD